MKYEFESTEYWTLNILLLLMGFGSLAYGFFISETSHHMYAGYILIGLGIIRIFVKERPPVYMEYDKANKKLKVTNRFPVRPRYEEVDTSQLLSASHVTYGSQYYGVLMKLKFKDGSEKRQYFEAYATGNVITHTKVGPEPKLVELINSLNDDLKQ